MANAARSSILLPRLTTRTVRDHAAIDAFLAVVIFSLAGLLTSLAALVLGLPQVFD